MTNQYDIGIQKDFDNMTRELGTEIVIFNRDYSVTHEGQEGSDTEPGYKHTEIASIQELEAKHEVVASGQLNVGDLKITLQHDSIAQEEGYIEWDNNLYKILDVTRVRGLRNDVITHITAHGKKVPNR